MRAVICYQRWTLTPDREPDAEPVAYAMQCAVCGDVSGTDVDFTVPQDRTFRHAGRHPSHHTYREVITRPWRAWRDPGH